MPRLRLPLLLVLSSALVGCDHATKELAASHFRAGPLELFGGLLTLTYTENRDMAFNLLEPLLGNDQRLWLLTLFKGIAVIAGLSFLILRHAKAKSVELMAVALVVAGAMGNLIDRVTRGYVVDFLELPHWPVFNVADIVLCVGFGLVLLQSSGARSGTLPSDT